MSQPEWDANIASDVIARHVGRPGALLPLLHDLQAAFGYVPEAALPLIAEALNLGRAEVHGVVSFYPDFRSRPAGRHVLKLCRAEACQATGADAMANRALGALGLDWHGTTADARLTVEPVHCVGLCATAPAALLDDRPHGRLTSDRLARIIEACTA